VLAGVIAETQLAEPNRARADYQRVLALDPEHDSACLRHRRLDESVGDFASLAALVEDRLAIESEPWRLVELHIALAQIGERPLQDPARARAHLCDAVRLHATTLPALRALVELDLAAERWSDAVETLVKMAQLERDGARLRDVFFKLGVVHADHL